MQLNDFESLVFFFFAFQLNYDFFFFSIKKNVFSFCFQGRIKKIMQTDEEVGKIAQAVPIIIYILFKVFKII